MRYIRLTFLTLLFVCFGIIANAQRPEIALTLNEQFFDAAIDAVLAKGEPPFIELREGGNGSIECRETIRVTREMNGVRTAVKFRGGKIVAPIAFNGSYRLPLVGCIDFAGWSETNIEIEFDAENQRVLARAKVQTVSLNGTAGIGKSLLAPLVQSTIDKKINPIEIVRLDRLAIGFPLDSASNIRIRATGIRTVVQSGSMTIHLPYEITRQ